MLEIKTWLERTTMKVAEEHFLNPPALPYIIFSEDNDITGSDDKNCIANRAISIELYSGKIDKSAEGMIENLLHEKAIQYKRDRTWIDSENFFQTIYDFNLIEKF